ncbi:MAG: hypothetical protein KAG53_04920 [Endozoicomonadaceae bacterium]|nr:hypothetical protein [Endozoicomonadaceae bacterium]
MSIDFNGNNQYHLRWTHAFRFSIDTDKGPLKYCRAVLYFFFGRKVAKRTLENYMGNFSEGSLAKYVHKIKLFERTIQNIDPGVVTHIKPQQTESDKPEDTANKHVNPTLPQVPPTPSTVDTTKHRETVPYPLNVKNEDFNFTLTLKSPPKQPPPTPNPSHTTIQSPELKFTQWIPVAKELESNPASNPNQVVVLDKNKYCINSPPKITSEQNEHTTILGHQPESLQYGVNIDLSIDTAVDVETGIDTSCDIQTEIASASKDVFSAIGIAANRFKEKLKTWQDFVEKDSDEIKKYREQMENAENRFNKKEFDALSELHLIGTMQYGPPKNFKVFVSEDAAEKYHELYCNATPVKGYQLGQKRTICNSREARHNGSDDNELSVNMKIKYLSDTTEQMCFDNVIAGFVLIQNESDPSKVYICFDKNYCHPNSKILPVVKTATCTESIIGLVPDFDIIEESNKKQPELIVKGENNYSYQNPPTNIPLELQKQLKSYSDDITNLWINRDAVQKVKLNDPSWDYGMHPFQKLANKDVCLIGDFNGKEALFPTRDNVNDSSLEYICRPNLNFKTYESLMYKDHKKISEMAKITETHLKKIIEKHFPELTDRVDSLLSEKRIQKGLMWTDENGNDSSHYCKALNEASSTSGCALRRYLIGRRLIDILIALSQRSDVMTELKEHLDLILSMDEVQTELCTDDYEAFYEDPTGNKEEGLSSATPKPAIPVIRDNLAMGGLVLKPFVHSETQKTANVARHELGDLGYLEVTENGSTKGYGAYDYMSVAVCAVDNPNKWIPMSYNYHTDSLIPQSYNDFGRHFASQNDLHLAGMTYRDYLVEAKKLQCRVLVKDKTACKRPQRVKTKSTNDLFGVGGLNIMSWPAMRHCAIETDGDGTRWKARLQEETALLKRYKALTPRGRAMALELALSTSNAKKQPYVDPQKIRFALDSAIYMIEVAIHAAGGNEDVASQLIVPIRHMAHIHMPGGRMTAMQQGSLESRNETMTNYIKAHKDPGEALISLRKKLIMDPSASFLKNGLLEKETEFLSTRPNTFLTQEMLLHEKSSPAFINKGEVDPFYKNKNQLALDAEIRQSSESGHIDITHYVYRYNKEEDKQKCEIQSKLDGIANQSTLGAVSAGCKPRDIHLSKIQGSDDIVKMMECQYLDKDKADRVCGLPADDSLSNLDTLFNLNLSRMKQNAESIMLKDTKTDAKILYDLTKEPENEFNIQPHCNAQTIVGPPSINMCKMEIEVSEDISCYAVIEGKEKTKKLEIVASQITGALPIAVSSDDDLSRVMAISCAKAIALRALSTTNYRPEAHTCAEGIHSMTSSDLFQNLPENTQFDALRYTTAALTQNDCQVENQGDFSLWNILANGECALPKEAQSFHEKEKKLQAKIKTLSEIIQHIDDFNGDSGLHTAYMRALHENKLDKAKEITSTPEYKKHMQFFNDTFDGFNIDETNVEDILGIGDTEGKSNITWLGTKLYPELSPGIKKEKKFKCPLSDEVKKANLKFDIVGNQKCGLLDRLVYYKKELNLLESHNTETRLKPHQDFPSNEITRLFIEELDNLRAKKYFLPLQSLKAAALKIGVENQATCIEFAKQGDSVGLKKLIASTIEDVVKNRDTRIDVKKILGTKFANQLKPENIMRSIEELTPIKDHEQVTQLQNELKELLLKEQTQDVDKQVKTLEASLNKLKTQNGILLNDRALMKEQVNKLALYTQEVIDKGMDSIATDYKKLRDNSDGNIDDKIKVLSMIIVTFAYLNKMSLPRESQIAAILASINSQSRSQAIGAESGSGKSVLINPALSLIHSLGRKNENLPIFATYNETLLQQDFENFKPWGKIFNFSIYMLDANFENNMKKYTEKNSMVFGTPEMIMGDRLRLNTLDFSERLKEHTGTYDSVMRCPNHQLFNLFIEGFNRSIILDEFDTIKDKDCSGALIISESSTKQSNNWATESYQAFFEVFETLETKKSTWQEYRAEMKKQLEKEKYKCTDSKQTSVYDAELKKTLSMNEEDWSERIESLRRFLIKKDSFQLQKTYTIGYEAPDIDHPSKKVVVTVPNPCSAVIEEHKKLGHQLKIYPINQTTAEIVKNASFADNGSNYLAHMHGLPPSPATQTIASAAFQTFFDENFGNSGIFTVTATYGSGEMLNDLIPEGRTNICYKSPYEYTLAEHKHQVFENKIELYDNVVNMAGHYIEQGMDVIILSTEEADVFALDHALGLYGQRNKEFLEKAKVLTLANLQEKADHQIFQERVGEDLNTPFGRASSDSRKKGSVINATDACSRGFNFKACNAVIISVGCPPSERAKIQKWRRVGRTGNKGVVHSLMMKDSLPEFSEKSMKVEIGTHGGQYSFDIQNHVTDTLLLKDTYISNQSIMRNNIQKTTMRLEREFTAYHQKLKVLEAMNQKQLLMTKKINLIFGYIVSSIKPGIAEDTRQAWHKWRDKFVATVTKNSKSPEDVDSCMKILLEERDVWNKFITVQPYYKLILDSDFSHKKEDMPRRLLGDNADDFKRLTDVAKLENVLYTKLHAIKI